MNANNVWRDVFSPASDLHREFNRLFGEWSAPSTRESAAPGFAPACDVVEGEDHYVLTLELAGVSKDDIKIELNDGQLSVSGERKRPANTGSQWYSERRTGRFQRSFALPPGIDGDKVEADYQDGILTVSVPKAETAKPRQIKIGAASGPEKLSAKLSRITGQSSKQSTAS